MRPTLFHLGAGLPIHSYGFLIALGMVVGVLVAVRRGRSIGIETGAILDLCFYAIVVGLLGARLLYVLMHLGEYARLCTGSGAPRTLGQTLSDCSAALHFWQGGLVFLGGGILAAAVVLLFARKQHLRLGDVADVLSPSVSIAHVFGRLGCFMVGCCYGKPWQAGVRFPPDSVAYSELAGRRLIVIDAPSTIGLHPTQLYESLGELLIFGLLLWLWRRRKFPGAVALGYAMAYGPLRFVVEIFRGDGVRAFLFEARFPGLAKLVGLAPEEALFLSTAQAMSLGLAVAGAALYLLLARRAKQSPPASS